MPKPFSTSDLIRLSMTSLLLFALACDSATEDNAITNKPPVISNLSPANESIFTGEPIQLSVDASDEDGTVSKVEFKVNNVTVGEVTAAPFEIEWTPAASNHYTIKALATDDNGTTTTSQEVSITAVGYSCTGSSTCTDFSEKEMDHVITAFYPSWKKSILPIPNIRWESLTHIIYSFALPVEGGELNTSDLDGSIDQLVAAAHEHGVKVYISIGGANGSEPFIDISKNVRDRALFIDRVNCYLKNHCLDGVDIDWEHWNGGANVIQEESNGLVTLLEDLRSTLPEDKELSVDVYASNWFGKHYLDEVADHADYIHVMAYDLRGPWSEAGAHSKYEEVIDDGTNNFTIEKWGLMYWTGYRQWPVAKTVVGMPFYGRDFDLNNGEGVDYRILAERVSEASGDINSDRIGNAYFDGPSTAARKAAYARDNGYAGVMFWELTGDSTDPEVSLLKAIDEELKNDE